MPWLWHPLDLPVQVHTLHGNTRRSYLHRQSTSILLLLLLLLILLPLLLPSSVRPLQSSGVTSNCGPPQTNVRGLPALPRTSSGSARVSGARGIDHFGALPKSPFPPLRSTGLKVGRLNPARGFGGALSALQWGLGQSPSRRRFCCILRA